MKNTLFALIGMVCLIIPYTAHAQLGAETMNVDDIRVNGNQRIESSTIQTYLGISPGDVANQKALNEGVKELYKTGFFSDVSMKRSGNDLIINVVENPSINRVAFEGNKHMSDEDLETEASLRARSIYTRPAVQKDVKRLLDVYRRNGRYSAKIEPKVIQKEQNRIDLVYEIQEGAVSDIRKITFIGNESFAGDTLEKVINSEEYRWYKFLSNGDKYDPDRLAYDQELLRRFYRSEGYADFQVKSAFAELTPDREAFYLTFTITEGPRYTFGNIDVASSLEDDRRPNLTENITTLKSDRFNANEVETSIDKMIETLGDSGFAFVDIDPKLKRRDEANIIDLTYNIKEGPRVYVERINIYGNSRTLDRVIRREFRVTEGDPYSTTKLQRSEQRLNNLGFFETVNVSTEQGSSKDKTIINVEVVEKSTGEITLGAGFSSTDGALADVGITERNLLGRGQELRARVLAASKRQQFDVGFTEPYTFNRELSTGIDIYKTTQDLRSESSYDRDALGGKLRAGYRLSEKLSHNVFYAVEQNEVTNVNSDASRFIRDQEGENLTSMIGHSFIYDGRNNRFAPTEGWFWRANQDFAGVGGDDKFVRHEILSEYYIPIAKQWTLSFAGSAGHMIDLDDGVRINQRFFTGGRDLRGFEDAGVGPRDTITKDSLGGNVYYTGSTEIQFPLGLSDDLGLTGAFFVDVGSLWDVDASGPEVADQNSLRAAAGFGLGWASPFGPIRIDFAKPFLKEDYDIEETIRFSFGTRF